MGSLFSKNKFVKSVLTVSGISILTRGISFLFKIYLSRTLGAETMGLYQTSLTVFFLFIALSTGGISTVLSRKIAEFNANGDKEKGFGTLTSALFIGVSLSTACTLLAYLIIPKATFLIPDERAIELLKIMLPALFSTTFYIIIRGWFWGNKLFWDFSLSELTEEILRLVFTLFFLSGLFSGINGATGLAFAFTLSDFLVLIIIVITYFLRGGKVAKRRPFSEIIKPATPLTIMKIFASLTGTVVALVIPQGLIAGGLTVSQATESVGRISAMANPLLFAPNTIINSLAIVLIPELSELNAKKEFSLLRTKIADCLKISIVISGAFMVIYSALGKELTTFLYSDSPSGEYLQKASVILLLAPVNAITSSSMNSIGLEKQNFISYLVGGSVMLVLSFILPKHVGINAVIIADTLFLLLSCTMNTFFLRKRIGGDLGILKSIVKVAILGVPCMMIGNNLSSLTVNLKPFLSLLTSGMICFLVYLLATYVFGALKPKIIFKKSRE